MRILVHEFVSGGGLAGRDVAASLAREGLAMLTSLIADLAAIHRHQIVTTVDPRFALPTPPGVEIVTLSPGSQGSATLDAHIASADAVWLVAPETNRCLERLAVRVERRGKILLGSGATAIRRASDKARLPRRLARHGIPHPKTRVLRPRADWGKAAREIGYPLVVKPARGAGCEGVCLARDVRELRDALDMTRRVNRGESLLLQRYVTGTAASVSLLANGRRAVALTVNAQSVRASRPFSYRGGKTPLDHPLAGKAVETALRTCQALPGLRGYIGVDMVLTGSEAVVIEVNPRLTTAYLGVRSALGGNIGNVGNVAAMVLAACAGTLPVPPPARQRVRFTAAGRIHSLTPYSVLTSCPRRPPRH
jgi:predicted ATP-grasp superfamily ATP-dependent carboligase